jgi:hypothetical protein
MKTMALALGAGFASMGASVLGASTKQVVEPADRRERRRPRRESPKTRYRSKWVRWNVYQPHQGKQEIARRARQIEAGKLRFFVPGVTAEATRFQQPAPIKAQVLIDAGLEAERQQKNRLRAEKAARTRAANKAAKLEASNG